MVLRFSFTARAAPIFFFAARTIFSSILHAQDEVAFKKQSAADLAAIQKRTLVLFHAWVQVRATPGRSANEP